MKASSSDKSRTTEVILSRHGNTFAPGDRPVWVGRHEDLPLVPTGKDQAHELALALQRSEFTPDAIICSPLQRTKEYAAIVVKELALRITPAVDDRLNEIDYGEWSGLSNEEVAARFGREALDAWNERSIWPPAGVWGESESNFAEQVRSFGAELQSGKFSGKKIVVVTSNGRLRYFLQLLEGEFARRISDRSFSVKTGHVGKLVFDAGSARLEYWNQDPKTLARL